MPQPPPADAQDGALGQADFEDDDPEAKVDSRRSVSGLSHSGQETASPAF
jgi:hypothetical protein